MRRTDGLPIYGFREALAPDEGANEHAWCYMRSPLAEELGGLA